MKTVIVPWPEPVLLVARPCDHESVKEGEIGVSWHRGRRSVFPAGTLPQAPRPALGIAVGGNLLSWAKKPLARNSYPFGLPGVPIALGDSIEALKSNLWADLRAVSLAPMPVHYIAEGEDAQEVGGWLGVPRPVLVEVEAEERKPWEAAPEDSETELVQGFKYFRLGQVVRYPANRKHPTDLKAEAADILNTVMRGAAVDKLDRLLDLAEGRGGRP